MRRLFKITLQTFYIIMYIGTGGLVLITICVYGSKTEEAILSDNEEDDQELSAFNQLPNFDGASKRETEKEKEQRPKQKSRSENY